MTRSPRAFALSTLLAGLAAAPHVPAKNHALQSPAGRQVYTDDERFADVLDQSQRRFVVEVSAGAAPEGNLGLLLGVLNLPVRGLEYYGGVGLEVNPAVSAPFSARYMFNIDGYRPFVSAGYVFRYLDAIESYSHNVFFEVGYKWIVHTTHHITLGVGVRRPLVIIVEDDSPLRGADTDRALLERELAATRTWVPTAAIRFSRAF